MRALLGIAGVAIILGTALSEVKTLVVPRSVRPGLNTLVARIPAIALQLVANRCRRYELKDRVLAYAGPLTIVARLIGWLASFLLGYTLLFYAMAGSLTFRASA